MVENKNKKTTKKPLTFRIHRVLKQVDEDKSITSNCANIVDKILCYMCDKLCNAIKLLMTQSQKKIVTVECVVAAVKLTMSGTLDKYANKDAQKSLETFATNKNRKLSRSEKAGLVFSVSKTEKRLRKHLQGYKISSNVPIYMTAVIEYISAEILDLSSMVTRHERNKHARITENHLYKAIQSHEPLCTLFKNIIIPNSGVIQDIKQSFLPKKKGGTYSDLQIDKKYITNAVLKNIAHKGGVKYISKDVFDEVRKMLFTDYLQDIIKHIIVVIEYKKTNTITKEDVLMVLRDKNIFLMMGGGDDYSFEDMDPEDANMNIQEGGKKKKKKGTLALQLIRRMQKKTELFIPITSFHKLIKKIVNEIKPNLRISSDGLIALQHATEDYLNKLFKKTVIIAVHDKRQTIYKSDFELIQNIDKF